MKPSIAVSLALLVAVAVAPLGASAQEAGSHQPPKLLKQGKASSPIAGKGTVIVQVLVYTNGTFKVQRIIHSTNAGDNKAALEIAQSSKYRSALRNGKPDVEFYDFTLKFKGGTAVSSGDEAGSGELAQYQRMLEARNFNGAKSGLEQYLTAHPGDTQASLTLAVANANLHDYAGAVKAFDSAGTIPPKYVDLAGAAYSGYAAQLAKGSDPSAAIPVAKKAVTLAPIAPTYNSLGYAELLSEKYTDSVADLEKAKSLAAADTKMDAKAKAVIDTNLVQAYIGVNDLAKAKATAADAVKADADTGTNAYTALANYYFKAGAAKDKAGDSAGAASIYEEGAAAVPPQAATLYARAAFAYLNLKPSPDNAKAKATADKALALDGENAAANFAAGVALANQGNSKDALVYLNKADAAAKKGTDTAMTSNIEAVIKQLGGK